MSNNQLIEELINAAGALAPRVTPDMVDEEIESVWYINAGTGVVPDADGKDQTAVPDGSPLRLLTFCVIVLKNGFTVTGESACASPENYCEHIGREIALGNAKQKIWGHLGFRLRDSLAKVGL